MGKMINTKENNLMKKIINKKTLAMCVTAAAFFVLPLSASAVDKLVVKDATSAEVFKVDDTGTVTGKKLAVGTTTPQVPLHINLPSVLGVLPDVGTGLYSISTGATLSTQNNSSALDLTVADESGVAGYRGTVRGVRARGSLLSPTAPAENDFVFSIIGGVWDGLLVRNNAEINLIVDGPVSPGVAPVRISFRTRTGGVGGYTEKMTIKNDGKVGIGAPNPTSKLQVVGLPVYEDNAEATAGGLTAGAFYRTATGVLMVAY